MKSRLKVIFVTPLWDKPRTGPEVYAKYLWESFRDDPDIEFHLVAGGEGESHPRLHLVKPPGSSLGLYRDVARRAIELMRELGSKGVFHVNNSNFHHSLLNSTCSIVGQINDYEAVQFRRNPLLAFRQYGLRRFIALWRRAYLEKKFVRSQAVTLCNSEFTRAQISCSYNMEGSQRLRVVYKAVDVARFMRPSAVSDAQATNTLPVILFVGSDFRRKGLDILVKAILYLKTPVCLRVAGVTHHEFESTYPGLARAACTSGSVIDFIGVVERTGMPALLWQSNLFCMPSRAEALGVALLEGLAAGLPCVATQVGGIPEIARHFSGVSLVPPEDPIALAKAIDCGLAKGRLSVDADKIRTLFGRESMASAVKRVYTELFL
jgi:glycosyltransferase involved in cell wall biosynthesis